MRRIWRRWRCKCDCHGPGLAVPGLGWLIVTEHVASTMCCDRGRLAQANVEEPEACAVCGGDLNDDAHDNVCETCFRDRFAQAKAEAPKQPKASEVREATQARDGA